jgi:hypothetical protein
MPGFANNMLVLNMGLPDVCDDGPIVIPYVNLSETILAIPAAPTILVEGTCVQNMLSDVDLSEGDLGIGLASGMCMGPTFSLIGSFTVLMEASPVTTTFDVTLQNLSNCPGMHMTPGQVTVLVLSA